MWDYNLVVPKQQPNYTPRRYNIVIMVLSGGEWIRKRRGELGMLQRQLAERSGLSVSYISTLERGQKHSITGARLRPEPSKVTAIAKALKSDPSELLDLYGYASEPREPQTVREFKARLAELGVHLDTDDDADDSPEALENLRHSLAAFLQAISTKKK